MIGNPIPIPLPAQLCETLGAHTGARYIGFEYSPCGDQIVWSDGISSGSGATWSYLSFKRHPAVRPHLEPFDLGSSEEPATHMLIVDRETNRATVALVSEARAFLAAQHPPQEPMTPEEMEAVRAEFERLLAEMRERPIDHEAIARQMREQSTRLAVVLAFLDQLVSPGQGQVP